MNGISEIEEFISSLRGYVEEQLRTEGLEAEYIRTAVHIVDARNHIFESVGDRSTAEEENVFAIRDMLCVDSDTLEMCVNMGRLQSIARIYFY